MKKDNLERFVRDNREAFDDRETQPLSPVNDLWRRIETELDKQRTDYDRTVQSGPVQQFPYKTGPITVESTGGAPSERVVQGIWFRPNWISVNYWRVAASVALLLLAASFLYMNYQYGMAHQPELLAASPTYAKEVVQYTRLIDNKRDELKQMTEGNPALYREFATDLDRLENSYQSLKADLSQNPNQDVLIQAMIQNLHYQINLLNEQLRVIQRINRQTDENPV